VSTEVTDRPENSAELADLIESLTVFDHDGSESGYEQSADAMWKAALAAFEYVARRVGATGFQASWSALRFYGEAMHVDGPYMVVQLNDALYPQYDVTARVPKFIEENRGWLREQAQAKLAEYDGRTECERTFVHPDVAAHWRKLAEAKP
jgi:hypothetical protein